MVEGRETDYDIVLGCRDSHVRVISGAVPSMDLTVDSSVVCITNYQQPASVTSPTGIARGGFKEIVYVTQRGTVGQLLVRRCRGALWRGLWALGGPFAVGVCDR